MHWADVVAQKLERRGNKHIIASGITPSGEFHVGHLREILTADIISRACRNRGLDVEFVFIIDSADPLRKVYDFLDPSYQQYIGHPLGTIPAPDEDGKPSDGDSKYSDHFLSPFMAALSNLGVKLTIIDNLESYRQGKFAEAAKIACENVDKVREIIERVSGRELESDWYPYNPFDSTGSMDDVKVTGFEHPHVHWIDSHGVEGTSDINKAEGKLPWRLDWPARWAFHSITCEPFGKDHGTSGGSYSTGRELVKLFGAEPPEPLVYEWIMLSGVGAMSSSTGISVGPLEALKLVPPEILRYLVARSKPNRHIEFDTGSALIELAEEYRNLLLASEAGELDSEEGLSRRQQVARATKSASLEYSQIVEGEINIGSRIEISFRHLAMVAQIRADDAEVYESLARSEMIDSASEPEQELVARLAKLRYWLASPHFPEAFRLRIQDGISDGAAENMDKRDQNYLVNLRDSLATCEWETQTINNCVCDRARELEMSLRDAFVLLYWIFLDQNFGPKLSPLLSEVGREQTVAQLALAIAALEA